jgi:hypothetical protein
MHPGDGEVDHHKTCVNGVQNVEVPKPGADTA